MNSELTGNYVILKDQKGANLNEKSHYGNLTPDGLQLSLIEALYLLEKEKITILKNNEEVSIHEMLQMIREEGLLSSYLVFSDLRNRGYIIKTGFKYGS